MKIARQAVNVSNPFRIRRGYRAIQKTRRFTGYRSLVLRITWKWRGCMYRRRAAEYSQKMRCEFIYIYSIRIGWPICTFRTKPISVERPPAIQ
ncbi:hypothetical protein [Burkholderia ambifaria]|uniref:hypothetical protein n=1 Tax=Burkholderia ambifaria TaxID=152480 RepID=UPI00158B63C6|nr:hypothetical protein [Burkholderia ambifaria]